MQLQWGDILPFNNFANQLQIILEQVIISALFLILLGLCIRARNVLLYLPMGRLTNLILCQDLINCKAVEEITTDGIWNKWYRILLLFVAAPTHENSKGMSILCNSNNLYGIECQGRTLKVIKYDQKSSILKKSYFKSISGNMDMRCRLVNQLPIRRSKSTVTGIEKDDSNYQSLNELSEVTKPQRMLKEAIVLLALFEKRLNRASKSIQKVFTLDNLVTAMSRYDDVVSNVEQTKKLNNFYDLLCNPCFLLIAYERIKKDATVGLDNVKGNNMTLSGLRTLSKALSTENYRCIPVRRLYINKPQRKTFY